MFSTLLFNVPNITKNFPSFSASDGQSLRVYQAVIDARTLLAEMNQGNPKQNIMESSLMSMSSQGI